MSLVCCRFYYYFCNFQSDFLSPYNISAFSPVAWIWDMLTNHIFPYCRTWSKATWCSPCARRWRCWRRRLWSWLGASTSSSTRTRCSRRAPPPRPCSSWPRRSRRPEHLAARATPTTSGVRVRCAAVDVAGRSLPEWWDSFLFSCTRCVRRLSRLRPRSTFSVWAEKSWRICDFT